MPGESPEPSWRSAAVASSPTTRLSVSATATRARRCPSNAVFRIASMTKPVASLALMMLAEEGRVMLWHPVSRYIPEFADAKVGMERAPAEREMTVQDLLRHTSGLTYGALPVPGVGPHPVKQAYTDAKVVDPDQTIEEFIARLARQPLLHQPGTHWEYSHSTDVVGRIVEVVSGLDLDRFIRERISAPLGLADTGFWAPPGGEGARRAARRWTPPPAASSRSPTRWRSRACSRAAAAWSPRPRIMRASAKCCWTAADSAGRGSSPGAPSP